MHRTDQTSVCYAHQGAVFLGKKGNSALSEHIHRTQHTTARENSRVITSQKEHLTTTTSDKTYVNMVKNTKNFVDLHRTDNM